MDFSYDTIKKLAELVSDKKLGKISVKNGDCEIVIEGCKPCPPPTIMGTVPSMIPMPHDPMPATANAAASNASATVETQSIPDGNVVKSPIVGTFYASATPDKPAFVSVGQSVKKGDVLMIIESMKLMNEIQSQFDGTVEKIFVKNGDAVEYDQPLMIIK